MITSAELTEARRLIADRFITQCQFGPQTKEIGLDLSACGQFLDDPNSNHRGLHGTAAAVRVLAEDARPESKALVSKLILYLQRRRSAESTTTVGSTETSLVERLARDTANVIKVSELLYALKFVDSATADTETLKKELADSLRSGRINQNGWGYFLDRTTSEPELLATAHAVRALAVHGYGVDEPINFLVKALTTKAANGASEADISVRVFCLYALSFVIDLKKAQREHVQILFSSIWRRLEGLLDSDIEQNIEYSRDRQHYYVRVPFQLYLLALAAKLAPNRRFASRAAQQRLRSIFTAIKSPSGFLYPHSGDRVSSRTNGILYEVFSEIEKQLERTSLLTLAPAHAVDVVRTFLNSRHAKIAVAILAFVLIGLSLFKWYDKGADLADLAPEFVAAFVLLLVTVGKSR